MFISYAHESADHEALVRELWILLRGQGIDAQLDLPASERRQDWPVWMMKEVHEADYVLVVVSPAYKRRAEASAAPEEGRGVQFEAMLIREEVYRDADAALQKFVPVLLPGASTDDIPSFLGPTTRTSYRIDAITAAGVDRLLRLLTKQPWEVEPPLGKIPALPPHQDWVRGAVLPSMADQTAGRRVIGVRPVASGSLDVWQDRDELRHRLTDLLQGPPRIISVIGRRGVGKSGVVTRVIADFEDPRSGQSPGFDGIVYLSSRVGSGEMTLAHIFNQVAALLPEQEQVRLSNRWAAAGESTLADLFDSLRAHRTVVVLDNLDDVQNDETGEFSTEDVPKFLRAVSLAPRAPHVVTTSQLRLVLPLEVQQSIVEEELGDGLAPEYGAALLRELDVDARAGLRSLDEEALRDLSRKVGGVPRGLQLLVGYVRDHRVSGVNRLLGSTSAPDRVLRALVSTTYDHLAGAAREVMEVTAVADVPLDARAVIALAESDAPDEVQDALDGLVQRCAVVLGDDGLVRLHPLDTDYVRSRLTRDRFIQLNLRLADWYASRRGDRSNWRRVTDADPVKHEYRHRWRAEQYSEALAVLAVAAEFLSRHGDSATLRSAVEDAAGVGMERSWATEVCRGFAEFFAGSVAAAAGCFSRASQLAGGVPEWELWRGVALRQSGRAAEGARALEAVAWNAQNDRTLRIEAAYELGLALCYAGALDEAASALTRLEDLIQPEDQALARAYVADVRTLYDVVTGSFEEAVTTAEEGIAAYEDSPRSDVVEYMRNSRGLALLQLERFADAAADFSTAAKNAASLGQDRLEGLARVNAAWASLHLRAWEAAATAAGQAAERLRSSCTNDSDAPNALENALQASSEEDMVRFLSQAADKSRENPDLHRPSPTEISEIAASMARMPRGGHAISRAEKKTDQNSSPGERAHGHRVHPRPRDPGHHRS